LVIETARLGDSDQLDADVDRLVMRGFARRKRTSVERTPDFVTGMKVQA
jgi:hypothetical protein